MPMPAPSNKIRTCSIWRALEVVGDTPSLLVLEAIWMGARRFNQLRTATGLQKALLSNRLKRLIENGILEKRLPTDGNKRFDYILTSKGLDLFPMVMLLYQWERKWGSADVRTKLLLRHRDCGGQLSPGICCGSCNNNVKLPRVSWKEGPGLGWMSPIYSRRRNQTKFQSDNPSLLRGSVEIMGDRWSALIMRSIFLQENRFDAIMVDAGIASNILSERLKKLTQLEVLKATPYQQNPVRYEYALTRKGFDYYSVITMLMFWGDKYYPSEKGPPVLLTHIDCGKPLNPYVSCDSCGKALTQQNVEIIASSDTRFH